MKRIVYIVLTGMTLLYQGWIAPSCVWAQDDEFLLGLIPEENIFRQVKKHAPLADYLSQKLGIKVRFTILSRYPDIIDRFIAREMDGAFFGIFTSVLAMEKLGVVPVARPVNLKGSSMARAYLFTRRDSGIRSVAQMRGRSAVFVDKATATGYLFVLAYLREKGVADMKGFFGDYSFTGSHESTIYNVLSERADVGVAKDRIFEMVSGKDPLVRDELMVIAQSEELPEVTLCVRNDLDSNLKEGLKRVLLSMHEEPEGREVLRILEAQKYIATEPEDFDVVYGLSQKAGVTDLKAFDYR